MSKVVINFKHSATQRGKMSNPNRTKKDRTYNERQGEGRNRFQQHQHDVSKLWFSERSFSKTLTIAPPQRCSEALGEQGHL